MLDRPLRLVRGCLHALVIGLLTLVVVRSVVAGTTDRPVVVALAVLVGLVYLGGQLVPSVGRSTASSAWWLAVLTVAWLLLLVSTPDGVWLAFPLFFLQLHLLPVRWGLAAVGVILVMAVGGFAFHQGTLGPAAVIGPTIGAAVAVATALGYQALYRQSTQRALLIEELTETRNELAAAERAAGVSTERERLAREIHDTLAQGLSSIQLLLRAAERALPGNPEMAAVHVEQARIAARENLAEARRFVHALAPPGLEGDSLSAALARLCETTTVRSGLVVHFHLSGAGFRLPVPYEVAILRIAQAALANTVQHARATRAEVTLTYMDSGVALDVVDDGVGFDPTQRPVPGRTDGGFGLAAMRGRARALDGTLTVESAPGEGTAVAVGFPLRAADSAPEAAQESVPL
ncbi:hemoglobin-dependent two component system, sensory histidine kinase HrrS [Pseudonocardia sp. N23]|nr:hemoglobin-dependent two component system, sensory histidine kinase HrrS [Pseudonocardia sp. N23]